jgi:uncharacterized integral membrane protein
MDDSNSHDPRFARTARTWEVELLISGVAVFAMLQLPGWLDDRMFALEPRLGSDWRQVLVLFYIYSKSTAVVLAVTFAIHLLLRAQWIALVGMDSVYPQGVLLDRLRMGPIQRAIEEARPESTADAIERADNRASVLFAIGVTIAMIIASVCIFFCGSLLVVNLLAQSFDWPLEPLTVMLGIFGLVMVPFVTASTIDQLRGDRLQPGGAAHRIVAAALRFYTRIGMGRRNNHVVALLTSNGGERRMMAVVVGVMVAALLGVFATFAAMRNSFVIGSYGLFPDSERRELRSEHYDDQRNPARDAAMPFVQSSVIAGPYLKLVVPYRPNRDEPAMRKHCAQASGLEGEARATARLACLQALHPVALDGKPLQDLQYEIASDPRTDRPALLAMIDVRNLAPGRHELRVAHPLRVDRKPDKDNPDPGFDTITFWR